MRFKLFMSLFIVVLFFSISIGLRVLYPLLFGLILFSYDAYLKGYRFSDWIQMAKSGIKLIKNLLIILSLVGFLTAGWRLSGTIQYLVYYGVKLISPKLFYFFAYLLTIIMSLLLGSINGTISTMGVVLISLARANGANLLITTGAILSGGIFGDRISPVSSANYMLAEMTETDVIDNRKYMFRCIIVPTIITGFLFLLLSLTNTGSNIDLELINSLKEITNLSHYCLIPALSILILSLMKVNTRKMLCISLLVSILIANLTQGYNLQEIIYSLFYGVKIPGLSENLSRVVNNGGLASMLNTLASVSISSIYFKIFERTKFLQPIEDIIEELGKKIGQYETYVLASLFFSIVFGTQLIVIILLTGIYRNIIKDKKLLMLDLSIGAVMIPSLIPWNMAANLAFTIYDVSFIGMFFNLLPVVAVIYYKFFRKRLKKFLTSAM